MVVWVLGRVVGIRFARDGRRAHNRRRIGVRVIEEHFVAEAASPA